MSGGVGFLNLPTWSSVLYKALSESSSSDLVRRPVLGRETVERPWIGFDPEEFFSAVEVGIHFSERAPLDRWTPSVITADPQIAWQRLRDGHARRTGFRAALGGTFPILDICRSIETFTTVRRLVTITDGVADFILGDLEHRRRGLPASLHEAQWRSIAPSNPIRHLHGMVARDRLALLGCAIFGRLISPDHLPAIGFSTMDPIDLDIAANLGFHLRLVGMLERHEEGFFGWVRPCLVPTGSLPSLASQGAESVVIEGADGSRHTFGGPGSSPRIIMRAIICDLARLTDEADSRPDPFVSASMTPTARNRGEFYLRLDLTRFAHTLALVIGLLTEHGVEIRVLRQPDDVGVPTRRSPEDESVSLVILTKPIEEERFEGVLQQIRNQVPLATIGAWFRCERDIWGRAPEIRPDSGNHPLPSCMVHR